MNLIFHLKKIGVLFVMLFSQFIFSQEFVDYKVDEIQAQEAHQLFFSPKPESISFPSNAEGAQWFSEASFGLFMHWGIHSVNALDPSWTMVKNCPWHQEGQYDFYQDEGRVHYYDLDKKFNPQYYDPDKWLAAAKAAGFTYAVLTTKHHDGYALWPTKIWEHEYQDIYGRTGPDQKLC